nr:MAG TPA: hypothetical protein [Bacteriophage sp.]
MTHGCQYAKIFLRTAKKVLQRNGNAELPAPLLNFAFLRRRAPSFEKGGRFFPAFSCVLRARVL